MTPTRYVDAHLHAWDPDRFRYEWLDRDESLNKRLIPSAAVLKDAQVDRAVFIQAGCSPNQAVEEARWASALHDLEGAPLPIGAVIADWRLGEANAALALERTLAIPRVVGVRRVLRGQPEEFFDDPVVVDHLSQLAHAGATFDLCISWNQLAASVRLLRQIPELVVVLDHMGDPPLHDPMALHIWYRDLNELAKLPNVHVKLSGNRLHRSSRERVMITLALRECLALFGPTRSMIGSDWPISTTQSTESSYKGWFDFVAETLHLSPTARVLVAAGTAESVYRIAPEQSGA